MNVIWLIVNLSTAIRRRFRLPVNGSTRTSLKIVFYWNTTTGNNSSTDVPLLRQNVKIKGKECFSYNFRRWSGCVGLQFPWLRNHLRLINNKNTSSSRCFDYVFLYSMLFYVNIWTGMVSNRDIDQYVHVSARSHGLRSTSQQLNTDLFPPWRTQDLHRRFMFMSARLDDLCPYFCLNPMVVHRKTCVLMYLQYLYVPFMAKITFDAFHSGSWSFPNCAVPRREFFQLLSVCLSEKIYIKDSYCPGPKAGISNRLVPEIKFSNFAYLD